jgi:hypothetical protein
VKLLDVQFSAVLAHRSHPVLERVDVLLVDHDAARAEGDQRDHHQRTSASRHATDVHVWRAWIVVEEIDVLGDGCHRLDRIRLCQGRALSRRDVGSADVAILRGPEHCAVVDHIRAQILGHHDALAASADRGGHEDRPRVRCRWRRHRHTEQVAATGRQVPADGATNCFGRTATDGDPHHRAGD